MTAPKTQSWHLEFSGREEAHLRGIRRILASEKTPYQKVEILDSFHYGKCLVLGDRMQSAEADEYVYHEALVHPALVTCPAPRRAAVVGGGEGATVREILRHRTVEKVYMVDIDERVVELCERHLPGLHRGSLRDPRTELRFEDGRKFLESSFERFDAVFVDLPEPVEKGPAGLLFTEEFYRIVDARLNDGGVVSVQTGSSADSDIHCMAAIHRTLREVFPHVRGFVVNVPSFDLPWSVCVASKGCDPALLDPAEVDHRLTSRGVEGLRFYDGITHRGLFHPPKNVRDALAKGGQIIRDASPLVFNAFGESWVEAVS